MAQIVDTPKRRAFMAKMGERGWLGITWPKEWGGAGGRRASTSTCSTRRWPRRGGPQIGKGVGIIGKTILAHGSDRT